MEQNKNMAADNFTVWFLADGLKIGDRLGAMTLPDENGKPVRYSMAFALDKRAHAIEFSRMDGQAAKGMLHRGLYLPEELAPGVKALWDMEEIEFFGTTDVPYARISLKIERSGNRPWEPEFWAPVDRPVHTAVPCLITECYAKGAKELKKCLVWYGDAVTLTINGQSCGLSQIPELMDTRIVIRESYLSGQPCLIVNMRHPYGRDAGRSDNRVPLTDRERSMARSAIDTVLSILEAEDAFIWFLSKALPEGDADAQASAKVRRNWKFLEDAWQVLEALVPAHALENGMLVSALWQDRDAEEAMEIIEAYLAN